MVATTSMCIFVYLRTIHKYLLLYIQHCLYFERLFTTLVIMERIWREIEPIFESKLLNEEFNHLLDCITEIILYIDLVLYCIICMLLYCPIFITYYISIILQTIIKNTHSLYLSLHCHIYLLVILH